MLCPTLMPSMTSLEAVDLKLSTLRCRVADSEDSINPCPEDHEPKWSSYYHGFCSWNLSVKSCPSFAGVSRAHIVSRSLPFAVFRGAHRRSGDYAQALQSVFERLSKSFSENLREVVLTVPICFTEAETGAVLSAFKAAGIPITKTLDHARSYLVSSVQEDYGLRNELILDVYSLASSSILVATDVEGGVRCWDVVAEAVLPEAQTCGVAALVHQLVDPALIALEAQRSTDSGPKLHRIVIIDSHSTTSTTTSLVPDIIDHLHSKFGSSPFAPQIVTETQPAKHAASIALSKRRDLFADACIFNVAPLRIGVAKADGFVAMLIPRKFTLPNHQTVVLTTSKDNQTKATVQIVAGVTPRVKDNTVVAELVLEGLTPRPRGATRVRVTLDVDQMGKTEIIAEELGIDDGDDAVEGRPVQNLKSVQLKKLMGDMTQDDIESYWDRIDESRDEEAEKAEALWSGKVEKGELSE